MICSFRLPTRPLSSIRSATVERVEGFGGCGEHVLIFLTCNRLYELWCTVALPARHGDYHGDRNRTTSPFGRLLPMDRGVNTERRASGGTDWKLGSAPYRRKAKPAEQLSRRDSNGCCK